ncbi:MAG TPA: 1,4-alpha-glucan branching protein GlgB [Methanoregulaceae archaeon]|nr:MAG: 1,4-alpha-glucan branching protein GlgB [Methanolinea sp.]HON82179.1 1,4-alpha-glucan branching protein GlgB [Methanoregulaceae archaeon]HPD10920.1 1,4-alpha-glucan branching protein GlgB [Methanoregulaceae archaeon]HRT16065.1 1,4-alpha-glucan branching protein GlgB [Methanoregulaceae archaeon]HRU31571.1 1,4-alpha-glucan branching protein GlgB [Methanoregulaceae archaeon]
MSREMAIPVQGEDSPFLSDFDIYLFRQGKHYRLYRKMGSHPLTVEKERGTRFSVWSPNARQVSVIGDFNGWDPSCDHLQARWDESGIWEGFVGGAYEGMRYKYHIVSHYNGHAADRGDPFAFSWEVPPATASIIAQPRFEWQDEAWMAQRKAAGDLAAPISIYEMHLGSWRLVPTDGGRMPTYRELAPMLAGYLSEMGFSHVEFLPVMEHPFYGSWGYQTTGYFAPTSRYGSPGDFMYLIDYLHRHGIGVILDWVPSHFPADQHGLGFFDGTHLYEHASAERGFHPEWKSLIFNYGRYEVQSFLISSALFWLDMYHVDGLRVDGVASMLYLDYARKDGEWTPNRYGGKENLEALSFLQNLNEAVYGHYPDVQTIAEESTAWPMVTRPVYSGGIGFGLKWNMGWMHDTLQFFSRDAVHRSYHIPELTFSLCYAYSENFVLCLSHDEVVHGKGSLYARMPGDDWQKMANLRLLFGYMFAHPGKKLVFMGGELGQQSEWDHESALPWHLLDIPAHRGIRYWIRDLNRVYREEAALHVSDFFPGGFEWIDYGDSHNVALSFIRRDPGSGTTLLAICNFTPVPRNDYRIGLPTEGVWTEILNSDSEYYCGSGMGNFGSVSTVPVPFHGRPFSAEFTLPPLAFLLLKHRGDE